MTYSADPKLEFGWTDVTDETIMIMGDDEHSEIMAYTLSSEYIKEMINRLQWQLVVIERKQFEKWLEENKPK